MPDYQLGKIYKIVSNETDKVYIGSTVEPILCRRLSNHRAKYKKYLNGAKEYCTSYEILKYNDAKIELIELYPCNSKDELCTREGYYQRTTECVNKNKIGRCTKEVWREYNKKYYMENKARLSQKINCECGGKYTYQNKTYHLTTKKHIKYTN